MRRGFLNSSGKTGGGERVVEESQPSVSGKACGGVGAGEEEEQGDNRPEPIGLCIHMVLGSGVVKKCTVVDGLPAAGLSQFCGEGVKICEFCLFEVALPDRTMCSKCHMEIAFIFQQPFPLMGSLSFHVVRRDLVAWDEGSARWRDREASDMDKGRGHGRQLPGGRPSGNLLPTLHCRYCCHWQVVVFV